MDDWGTVRSPKAKSSTARVADQGAHCAMENLVEDEGRRGRACRAWAENYRARHSGNFKCEVVARQQAALSSEVD